MFSEQYNNIIFYYLIESLGGVRPSELGFSSSMAQLPDRKPYGFWMDRHGNFIVVPNSVYSHAGIGRDIVNKANKLDHTLRISPKSETEIYDILFNLGWLRITLHQQYLFYQNPEIQPSAVTPAQKRNMKYIQEYYNLGEMVMDVG